MIKKVLSIAALVVTTLGCVANSNGLPAQPTWCEIDYEEPGWTYVSMNTDEPGASCAVTFADIARAGDGVTVGASLAFRNPEGQTLTLIAPTEITHAEYAGDFELHDAVAHIDCAASRVVSLPSVHDNALVWHWNAICNGREFDGTAVAVR